MRLIKQCPNCNGEGIVTDKPASVSIDKLETLADLGYIKLYIEKAIKENNVSELTRALELIVMVYDRETK